jgi:predicted NUDIX family NTP pyrophosphohydrolase
MTKLSAGLLMCRRRNGETEILLVHPGGPFWQKKDLGAWTFPRGTVESGEEPLQTAQREFQEETGLIPVPPFTSLGEIRQKSGKRVLAWAFAGDCDPSQIKSNTFELEWPPKSGRHQTFPEIDRADFFLIEQAAQRLFAAEVPFLERLQAIGW